VLSINGETNPFRFPGWVKMLARWQPARQPKEKTGLLEWQVLHETARTLRIAGYVEMAAEPNPSNLMNDPVPLLHNLYRQHRSLTQAKLVEKLGVAAARQGTTPEGLISRLVLAGVLARWVRLARDGISVIDIEIGPGCLLEEQLMADHRQNHRQALNWLMEQQQKLARLKEKETTHLPLSRRLAFSSLLDFANKQLQALQLFLDHRGDRPQIAAGTTLWNYPAQKQTNNYTLALEFLLALGQAVPDNPEGFEWKELGGAAYLEIGGSKRFDHLKDDLCTLAEIVTGLPVEELGLVSKGSLYSIYLGGRLDLIYSHDIRDGFARPGLYALTNIQVKELTRVDFPGHPVICTENRALLLKMYQTGWVTRQPGVLVVGIDGRIRKAHRQLLKLIQKSNPHCCFIGWVDTDKAGISIAGDLAGICPGLRMVLPLNGDTGIIEVKPYQAWEQCIQNNPVLKDKEQEQHLGNKSLWDMLTT